ncbi:MAG: 50S ribosomal protein L2 [Candidatus Coatesbacteria bacterium]|nr:MAG: 50S ribosomal protein L2 [Candidatus Coatesbacteria bacterium]
MAIKKYKPTSAGRRFMSVRSYEGLTKKKPEKKLTRAKKQRAGRDHQGRISVRHRGGGNRRKVRLVDLRRVKDGVPGRVAAIEYDPNRSADVALVVYADGDKRYVLANAGLKVGDVINAGPGVEAKTGNALPLRNIPAGTVISSVELKPGKGAQIARAAGTYCTLLAKEGDTGHVRLPSGEVRLFSLDCRATVGEIGAADHAIVKIGKAGRKRHQGIRPTVRGVAMNPNDHPHGGGEGKSKGGNHPTSPWGWLTKGARTRKKKPSDKYIVSRRKR